MLIVIISTVSFEKYSQILEKKLKTIVIFEKYSQISEKKLKTIVIDSDLYIY